MFTFASSLPAGKPRKVSGGRILIPIGWSFWKREPKPRMPGNVPDSALLRGIEVYRDGLGLKIGGSFVFTASTDAREKTLTIELRDPRSAARTKAAHADLALTNASVAMAPSDSVNATSTHDAGNASRDLSDSGPPRDAGMAPAASDAPVEPITRIVSRRVGPGQVLRSQIVRPEPLADSASQDSIAQPPSGERLQPKDARNQTEDMSARSAPVSSQTNTSSTVSPVAVVSASRRDASESAAGNASSGSAAIPPDTSADTAAHPATHVAAVTHDDANSTPGNATPHGQGAFDATNATNGTGAVQNAPLSEDVRNQLVLAEEALAGGKLAKSREILQDLLRRSDLPEEMREELLFMVADIMMQEGKDKVEDNFSPILQAYETAKNYNPSSGRLPEALGNMGYLHLAVGNAPEAKGYFDYLRRRFPDDPRVPMIDYYWGEHYAARGDFQKAADHFQYVLQNYPNSDAAEASSVGLLKCMSELGFADKAREMVDSIEKRWPDCAYRYPSFLMSAGYATMVMGELDRARDYFWRYYNLVPRSLDADMALVRIGDIFVKTGKHDAARSIFHKAVEEFPVKEGGLIAQMRLAEEGLLSPTGDFASPAGNRTELDPERVYTQILRDPQSSLAPVARLKLAMLHLWNKRYPKALKETERFRADYPKHDLADKAAEVENKAIREWILASLERGDFPTLLKAWDQYGHLLREGELDPRIRLAVATAMLGSGQQDQGREMAKPLIFAKPRSAYSEQGLDLLLANLVEAKQWRGVVDATREASTWNLSPDKQRVLDYTAALAHENLDEHQGAKTLWTKLSTDMGLSEDRRAYALYFLARDAMAAGDVERAGILAQDTLNLLVKDKTDIPKIKDCLEMLIRAAEASGRDRDALSWILQYDEYLPEADPNWPAFTYRKALLYRKLGEQEKWREIVQGLIAKKPDDLYSRMAASELEALRLEQETKKFR